MPTIEFGLRALPSKVHRALTQRLAENAMDRLLGVSDAMRRVRDLISKVAGSDIPVLVRGESGTGKELVARAIHDFSPRRNKEWVAISCPSLPEPLLESEMFGHTQGAFTGAHQAKGGLIEYADGGTLFLDEIGDLPLNLQAKLLRVLEDHEVRRVGSVKSIRLDLRFVAATNRDLESMLEARSFRVDLFARLNGVTITIPPLRERREDIPILLNEFLRSAARGLGCAAPEVSDESREALAYHPFAGNVRELRSMVERAVLLNREGPLQPEDFGVAIPTSRPAGTFPYVDCSLSEARARFEKEYLCERLQRCGGNVVRTAEAIGISRNQLHRLLRQHGLGTASRTKTV